MKKRVLHGYPAAGRAEAFGPSCVAHRGSCAQPQPLEGSGPCPGARGGGEPNPEREVIINSAIGAGANLEDRDICRSVN